ncbi:MAG: hypothetical protein ACOH15_03095 [Acetobacterium sp.]
MHEVVKLEREKRKKIRQKKKMRSTIMTITLIIIILTVSVVNAQTQGYEVLYDDQSLGFVRSTGVFESAVQGIEGNLRDSYSNDHIVLGSGFKLKECRVQDPMDLEACHQVLINSGIEIYVNGAIILIDDQEIGVVSSTEEAQSIMATYENLYPNGKNIRYIEQTIRLSETKDFGTILSHIKELIK